MALVRCKDFRKGSAMNVRFGASLVAIVSTAVALAAPASVGSIDSIAAGSSSQLPKGFKGNDYKAIIAALIKRPAPEKREFETTAAYEARLESWKSRPVYGSLLPFGRVAIAANPLFLVKEGELIYNADNETMTMDSSLQCRGEPGSVLDTAKHDLGTFIGQNGFGVKKMMHRSRVEVTCLHATSSLSMAGSFQVPAATALRLKYAGRLLFIGTLAEKPLTIESDFKSATMDDPEESSIKATYLNLEVEDVWLYDPATGKIYLRYASPADQVRANTGDPAQRCAPTRVTEMVGTWIDAVSRATRSIYNNGSAWQMMICDRDGSISTRGIEKRGDDPPAFDWVEKGQRMGNTYTIGPARELEISSGDRHIESMSPFP